MRGCCAPAATGASGEAQRRENASAPAVTSRRLVADLPDGGSGAHRSGNVPARSIWFSVRRHGRLYVRPERPDPGHRDLALRRFARVATRPVDHACGAPGHIPSRSACACRTRRARGGRRGRLHEAAVGAAAHPRRPVVSRGPRAILEHHSAARRHGGAPGLSRQRRPLPRRRPAAGTMARRRCGARTPRALGRRRGVLLFS